MLKESHTPFYHIGNVEWQIKQLFHLGGVNALMIDHNLIAWAFGKKHTEEVDGIERAKGDDTVADHFHRSLQQGYFLTLQSGFATAPIFIMDL